MRSFDPSTLDPDRYVQMKYYSGIMHGWITCYQDLQTGLWWWCDRNQWRVWHNGGWVFSGDRAYNYRANSIFGFVFCFVFVVAGLVLGGPATPIFIIFGLFCWLSGLGWDCLANRYPRTYQAAAVISTLSAVHTINQIRKEVREKR